MKQCLHPWCGVDGRQCIECKQAEPSQSQAIVLHPVQAPNWTKLRISSLVTLRAYEVYSHLYGEHRALVTGNCRGGFGAGELMALLYARSFPKEQWGDRLDEALKMIEV